MLNKIIVFLSNITALLGILFCFASGIMRILGNYYFMHFDIMTVFVAGLGLMVFSVLLEMRLLRMYKVFQ